MKKLKIIFIGCVHFSKELLDKVIKLEDTYGCCEVVGVISKEKSKYSHDFVSLLPVAQKKGIPFFNADNGSQDNMANWIINQKADIGYCFGWRHILKENVLSSLPMGIVGSHPAELPKNRGHHPIIWALALGLKETANTFLFLEKDVDSGKILSQKKIKISYDENASALYSKVIETAKKQVQEFTPALAKGDFSVTEQEKSRANVWRERTKADGRIDWRMTAEDVYNLVRALTNPYPGAHCYYGENEVKIWKVKPISFNKENIEPGKVLFVEDKKPVIKCGKDAVTILEHEFKSLPEMGDYLLII